MSLALSHIIGGAPAGYGAVAGRNPSDTDDVVAFAPNGGIDDMKSAIDAAQAAFGLWSRSGLIERHDILRRAAVEMMERRAELGALLSREEGKILAEGVGEVLRAAQTLEFFAGDMLRLGGEAGPSVRPNVSVQVSREPLGVVGVITPWNFPFSIPAWKIGPALAWGNCVVFKPAANTPACAYEFVQIFLRAGLPPGVLNLVLGRGGAVGDTLCRHDAVAGVSFTGSVETGVRIAAACTGKSPKKRIQMEMGGKNPLIVLDDAELDRAVDGALSGSFFSTGQRCTASSRLIVTPGIRKRFVAALAERMATLKVGHALDPESHIGPLASADQLALVDGYVNAGKGEGAKVAAGGGPLARSTPGYYYAPTLFVDADPRMQISREEIFGPVACVIDAANYEHALALANDTPFGLSAAIYTSSLAHAEHFKRNAEAGMVMVNLPTSGADYHVPFGGRKASSFGPREQGTTAREFYSIVKTAYTYAAI
jgi:acyl-CoA reductase-like NAD-dependent aldehyde dehydrogenase